MVRFVRSLFLAALASSLFVAVASAQDTRSQARNRELALERLQRRVDAGLAVRRKRRATRPSKAAVERRLTDKRRRSERKATRRRPVDDA